MTRASRGRRRVLVLAYYFPPLGGAGVQRTLKFVKYLDGLGYDATVITTDSRAYPAHDASMLDEVPAGTRLIRQPEVRLGPYAAMVLERAGLRAAASAAAWPDGNRGWAAAAAVCALREIRRERPDVLFSTSAPYSSHLAALAVQRLTGVPWVADYRDEWTANSQRVNEPRLLQRLGRRLEAAIAARAAHVVVAADYFDLAAPQPDDPRRTTIPNGVDEQDLEGLPPSSPPTDRFRLSHVGTLYGPQNLAPVLEALGRLCDNGAIDPQEIELRVVGNIWLQRFREHVPVRLQETGYVTHAEALAEMGDASALLLYVDGASKAPSGKLYEYLAAGRPIICVARRDNNAWRLVEEWDAGRCAEADDVAAIAEAILTMYRQWREGRLDAVEHVRPKVLQQFGRRQLAGRLAAVFDEAIAATR